MKEGGLRLSLPQVGGVLVVCVGAAWAVFAFTTGTGHRLEERAFDAFVKKDQFEEFKERFDKVENAVGVLQEKTAKIEMGVQFLVEKAKEK